MELKVSAVRFSVASVLPMNWAALFQKKLDHDGSCWINQFQEGMGMGRSLPSLAGPPVVALLVETGPVYSGSLIHHQPVTALHRPAFKDLQEE